MAESSELDDFLAHYGIPGMKWGKRKASSDSEASAKKPKRELSPMDRQRRKQKITAGIQLGLAAVSFAAPTIIRGIDKSYGSLLDAADAKNASRQKAGRDAATALIRGIGQYRTAGLAQGPDGRWRL